MHRFLSPLALRVLLAASALLWLVNLNATPAEAAQDKPSSGQLSDLLGTAFGSAGQISIVSITNVSGSDAIRAVLTVHDSKDALLGCGLQTIKAGEQAVLYIKPVNGASQGVLSVRVYGLDASGTLLGKLQLKTGLFGTIANADASNGEINSVVNMFNVASSPVDRQADIDACFGAGAASTLTADSNLVTTETPKSWTSTKSSKR